MTTLMPQPSARASRDAPSLIVEQASRLFGSLPAVEGASLALHPGQITALVGPSGAGKSTLLRIIAGLEPLDAGLVRMGEQVLSSPGRTLPPEKRRIGLVFQDYALFPHLTALANTAFGLAHLPRAQAREMALAGLRAVGLAHRADAFPHQLSGGEQQRVALARAIAPEPVALLLDEPFSGLDPILRAEVRHATLEAVARSGAATLIVTHDTEEALRAADALIVMRDARIVQSGSPEAIYAAPVDAGVAGALGPVNRFAGRVQDARAVFPLGSVITPLDHGCPVDVIVREEAVIINPTPGVGYVEAQVMSVRRTGPMMMVDLRLASGDASEPVRALVLPRSAPQPAATVWLSVDPSLTFVFKRPG